MDQLHLIMESLCAHFYFLCDVDAFGKIDTHHIYIKLPIKYLEKDNIHAFMYEKVSIKNQIYELPICDIEMMTDTDFEFTQHCIRRILDDIKNPHPILKLYSHTHRLTFSRQIIDDNETINLFYDLEYIV